MPPPTLNSEEPLIFYISIFNISPAKDYRRPTRFGLEIDFLLESRGKDRVRFCSNGYAKRRPDSMPGVSQNLGRKVALHNWGCSWGLNPPVLRSARVM